MARNTRRETCYQTLIKRTSYPSPENVFFRCHEGSTLLRIYSSFAFGKKNSNPVSTASQGKYLLVPVSTQLPCKNRSQVVRNFHLITIPLPIRTTTCLSTQLYPPLNFITKIISTVTRANSSERRLADNVPNKSKGRIVGRLSPWIVFHSPSAGD